MINNDSENVSCTSRKIRACISGLDPQYGGGSLAVNRVLCESAKVLGWDATFLYLSLKNKFSLKKEYQRWEDVKSISVGYIPSTPMLRNVIPAWHLRKDIQKFDIYLVGGAGIEPGMWFWLNGKKYICWVSTTIVDEVKSRSFFDELRAKHFSMAFNRLFVPPIDVFFDRKVYKAAFKILTLSRYAAEILEEYDVDTSKVEILPFPVDCTKFRPKDGDKSILPCRYILGVGRVDDLRKNFQFLIRAFAHVSKKIPDVKLVLCGSISPNNPIRRLVIELGLQDSVIFTGFISDDELPQYYKHADIFVLTSLQEGLGIVVLEAMASGIPVIATKCGGPEELIVDGYNGFLVPQNDEEQLAGKIISLLLENDLRIGMGQNARNYVVSNHNLEFFQQSLERVCRKVYPEVFQTFS